MTKLKQIIPYLLLVVLSFFTTSYMLGGVLVRTFGIQEYVFWVIFILISYVVYISIHSVLKKNLPARIYKDNKFVKFIVFFLIYTFALFIIPKTFINFIMIGFT